MRKVKMISAIAAITFIASLATVPAAMAASKYVDGTVIRDGHGISLLARNTGDRFKLEGQKNLSSMLGESVQIKGRLEEMQSGPAIKVISISPVDRYNGGA